MKSNYKQPNHRKINRLFKKIINDEELGHVIWITTQGYENPKGYVNDSYWMKWHMNIFLKFHGEDKFIKFIQESIKRKGVKQWQ